MAPSVIHQAAYYKAHTKKALRRSSLVGKEVTEGLML